MNNSDITKLTKDGITPQSFETNDGRIRVEIIDEDYFELTYYNVDIEDITDDDYKQTLTFDSKDRDILIKILQKSKSINHHAWCTIKNNQENNE
jgi:hypothetical protein